MRGIQRRLGEALEHVTQEQTAAASPLGFEGQSVLILTESKAQLNRRPDAVIFPFLDGLRKEASLSHSAAKPRLG